MTMPSGYEIASGYVTIRANIDKTQMNKEANEAGTSAGDSAGNSFNTTMSDRLRDSKGKFTKAGSESGSGFSDGFDKSSKGRMSNILGSFSSFFKSSGSNSGGMFSEAFGDKFQVGMKAVGGQLTPILVTAAVAAGPLIGATLGAGITAALGGGILAAGILTAMKNPATELAFKDFRNKIFGLSKEDEAKLKTQITQTQSRIAKMQAAAGSKPSGEAAAGIKQQQDALKKMYKDLEYAENFSFARATKGFQEPLQKGFEAATKFFLQLEPTFKRIFDSAVPFLSLLGKGFGGFLTKMLPGIEALTKKMTPIMAVLGDGITRVGEALGKMFQDWASDPKALEGMAVALGDVFGLLTSLIHILGNFIAVSSESYLQFKHAWGAIANFITGNLVPNFLKGFQQIKDVFWSFVNWITGPFKNFFVSGWNSVASWFAGIPKWFADRWNSIRSTFNSFTTWIKTSFKNGFTSAWSTVSSWFGGLNKWFADRWTSIRTTFSSALSGIGSGISSKVTAFKGYFTGLRDSVSNIFNSMSSKINEFKNGAVKSFQLARDGIGAAWKQVQDKAKGPINFIINPVYSSLRNLWNKVAENVGLKGLPEIKKFAKGGIAPGSGNRDTVPAMLTPGEGILTKAEMKKIGGAKGFANLRQRLQYFSDGGIVGGIKDWVGGKLKSGKDAVTGFAKGAIYPGAKILADKYIYPLISKMDKVGFSGLAKGGAGKLVDSALNLFKTNDSSTNLGTGTFAPHVAGSGNGNVMGWKNMVAAINGAGFNFHPSLGQTTGGGHATNSYHYRGRAVDLSPPSMKAFDWIKGTYGKNIKELIYGPAGGQSVKNGQNHQYSQGLLNDHFNHIHWAMDNGGYMPPKSTTMVTNATNRGEYALTEDKIKNIAGSTYVTNNITLQADQLSDMQTAIKTLQSLGVAFNTNAVG